MPETTIALIQLGAVFFGLGLLGRIAWKFGISPIPLYLVGGLAFGSGGLIPLHGIEEFAHLAGEIGVVLLLLLLGLEYSASELTTGLRKSWTAGLVDLVINAAPGAVAALLLGWGPVGALAMAGVTYISSSGIIAKVLGDPGRLGNRETPVILSVLVFEDLAMAVYLPVLTAVLAGAGFLGGLTSVGISLLAVTVVLVVVLRYGRSTAENATRMLEPLRDLFAAMGRARTGAALVARGEFSIVIAGLAVASGHVDDELAALATAYVLLMAIIGPVVAKYAEPLSGFLPRRRTASVTP